MDVPAGEKCKGQILHISETLQDLLLAKKSPRHVHYRDAEEEISIVSLTPSCATESCSRSLSPACGMCGEERRACRVGVRVGFVETAGAKHCG